MRQPRLHHARVISREPESALVVLMLAPNASKDLILGGIAALATPYITYTQTETVVDVGPIEIEADKEKTIPIPQIAAVAAIIIGIGMLALGARTEA